jgi:pimeloyl-ACP methyl ester carboxylesterase
VDLLVLVTGMIPAPGRTSEDLFADTGWNRAVEEQARRDGGLTGHDDPYVAFYHDVPRALAEEAMGKERRQSLAAGRQPWPLDAWPTVPTRFVLCTEDRFFPAGWMRKVVADRLALTPVEIAAGHCVPLSRPKELAALLVDMLATPRADPTV